MKKHIDEVREATRNIIPEACVYKRGKPHIDRLLDQLVCHEHNTYQMLLDALKEADENICYLCKRLNPQHKNCVSCDDHDERAMNIEAASYVEVSDD